MLLALLPQAFLAGAVPTPGGTDVGLSQHVPEQAAKYLPCGSKDCDKGDHDKDHDGDHDGEDGDHDGDHDHDHGDGDGDDITTVTVTDWYVTHSSKRIILTNLAPISQQKL